MKVLERLASMQNRKDDAPNQELARELAENDDRAGIQEIAENLWSCKSGIRSDCIKVLYEIGYIKPELIADCADDFIELLRSGNNRLTWGGMTALSTVAAIRADLVCKHLDDISGAMKKGSVITVDAGIRALSAAASAKKEYGKKIFPVLMAHIETCRPKDIPMHAEFILKAVYPDQRGDFIRLLNKRRKELSPPQTKRVDQVLKKI